MPNIFLYLEYRLYLKDYYEAAKKEYPYFSYRYFSQKAEVKAPNFLQLLIQGKRNLKGSTIPKVAEALKLQEEEANYFELLVQFDQETVLDKKTEYFNQMTEQRKAYNIELLADKQLSHYENWYNKAIRELLGFYPFYPEEKYAYRNLSRMVSPSIREGQAKQSVQELLDLDMLKVQDDGRIVPKEQYISTGDEVQSLFVRKFHRSTLNLASESLDRHDPSVRDISSLTVSVSEEGFKRLKQEVQLFRKRLMELVKQDSDPEEVYQVNFQLFPMTNGKKVRKKLEKDGVHNDVGDVHE